MFEVGHRKKMGFLRLKDVYYAEQIKEKDPGYDAVYYFFCQESMGYGKKYVTTVVDLSMDESDMLGSFRKSTRQDIKRIINDENLKIETIENPDEHQLKVFILRYNQFTRKKGFYAADHHRIFKLNREGRIVLLNARYDNELTLQQIMIIDDHKAVAFYGYTIRLQERDTAKLKRISAISKMVDYYCMLYWKKKNKRFYDLGGLFLDPKDPEGENINQYKDGFRGNPIWEYEFVYPLTWKGRVFCWMKEMASLIKHKAHID